MSTDNQKQRNADAQRRQQRRQEMQKKKKRQKNMRILYMALVVIAVVLIIALAIKAVINMGGISFGKEAETTTFTLSNDGTVVYEELISVSEISDLTEKELKDYIKEELRAYNESHGDRSINLNKVKIDDGVAYQKTTYKDVTCYSDFTGYEVYSGIIRDAVSSGYDFATDFIRAEDGSEGEKVSSSEALSDTGLSVLIIRENGVVKVPGNIRYYSAQGVRLLGADTAEVYPEEEGSDAAVLAYIIYE
ncbi:MAG: hypothetical protein J6N76_10430 [Lachnospiraceae bacterium]|nr:hypothetical protein [Lachnospiraceae bacterium]